MPHQFSYWENNSYFKDIDLVVVGSGIVGLSAAIEYHAKNPTSKVLILERGVLPNGASTKNAGFACFGSPSELLDDLTNSSEDEVFTLVEKRFLGLKNLRKILGDQHIDYQNNFGMELFTLDNKELYNSCLDQLNYLNKQLNLIVGANTYSISENTYGFKKVSGIIKNQYEGQIDTGKMMQALQQLATKAGILTINNCTVKHIQDNDINVQLATSSIGEIKSSKVIVATNGFAKTLLPLDVEPARAQVLITKPIEKLPFKGTFHYDRGYYYFRNIHNRVLFGGGRNLDLKGENTTEINTTPLIMEELTRLLKDVILPQTPHEIDYSWAGIMGVGPNKNTIVKHTSNNVICAVRMGGMGVAIGSLIGKEAAALLN